MCVFVCMYARAPPVPRILAPNCQRCRKSIVKSACAHVAWLCTRVQASGIRLWSFLANFARLFEKKNRRPSAIDYTSLRFLLSWSVRIPLVSRVYASFLISNNNTSINSSHFSRISAWILSESRAAGCGLRVISARPRVALYVVFCIKRACILVGVLC